MKYRHELSSCIAVGWQILNWLSHTAGLAAWRTEKDASKVDWL